MSDVADDITEQYATAMEEAIESATKAEAERELWYVPTYVSPP